MFRCSAANGTKAKQQNKPQSQGAMAMSKLYSLPELATPIELHGEEHNTRNVVNYPREQKQKVSAASLPPSITQHSSTHTKEVSEQEKARGPLPIYSIPDKSKKSMKTIVEPTEHEKKKWRSCLNHALWIHSLTSSLLPQYITVFMQFCYDCNG